MIMQLGATSAVTSLLRIKLLVLKVVTTTISRAGLSAPFTASVTWRARSASEFQCVFHNFRNYDAHLIVHEFGKLPDREI